LSKQTQASERAGVLIVDDEKLLLDEYVELLEFAGIRCLVEVDPFRAFERVCEDPGIKVVITDFQMSGMNGQELIVRLRASLPVDRKVTYALLSGYEDSLGPQLTDVYQLLKPIDISALIAVIRNGLNV
jgi:CheY-like chemotaxis protein